LTYSTYSEYTEGKAGGKCKPRKRSMLPYLVAAIILIGLPTLYVGEIP
jgi:hypothetical protein